VIVATLLAVVFAVHLVMAVNVGQRAQSAVTPTKIAVKSAWVQAQRHGHPKDICSVNAPLLLIKSLTQAGSGTLCHLLRRLRFFLSGQKIVEREGGGLPGQSEPRIEGAL
jgi:hypothetical protein